MKHKVRLMRGLLVLFLMGVTGLAPWGAVSAVRAQSATASNDALTVTAEGSGVLAVQSVGKDFDVYVTSGSDAPTISLDAKDRCWLVKPSPGQSYSYELSANTVYYEVKFLQNPLEEHARGQIRRVDVSLVLDSVDSADYIGKENGGRKVYATARAKDGKVIIKLKSDPGGAPIANGSITWTGGTAGINQLQRVVSKSTPIDAGVDVTAKVGEITVFAGRIHVFREAPEPRPTQRRRSRKWTHLCSTEWTLLLS